MKPTLEVTKDITAEVNKLLKTFKNDGVVVGIPEEGTARDKDSPINNATLLAINNFGSPKQNIPPRPVMSIGIRNAQDAITEQFRKILQQPSAGFSDWLKYLERVGIIASNSIKRAINDQDGIDPPAGSTLATRKSQGFKGNKALVVTGQMRNAITYVVRPGGNADVVVTKGQAKEL